MGHPQGEPAKALPTRPGSSGPACQPCCHGVPGPSLVWLMVLCEWHCAGPGILGGPSRVLPWDRPLLTTRRPSAASLWPPFRGLAGAVPSSCPCAHSSDRVSREHAAHLALPGGGQRPCPRSWQMGRPSRSPHAREPPCASHCLGARDRALCLITGIGVHTGTEALGLPEPLGAWGGLPGEGAPLRDRDQCVLTLASLGQEAAQPPPEQGRDGNQGGLLGHEGSAATGARRALHLGFNTVSPS